MGKLIDLTGQRFGRWTVLKRKGSKSYGEPGASCTFPLWLCQCDCGNEALVIGNNLKSGKSQSCGCLRDELFQERKRKRREERNATSL